VSAKRWSTFLDNHREVIAAMDFFTVPTLTFGILHCFFVIAHDRRRIIHCNVTRHPSSAWISQQFREAFPYDSTPSYLIFDSAATPVEEPLQNCLEFENRRHFAPGWNLARHGSQHAVCTRATLLNLSVPQMGLCPVFHAPVEVLRAANEPSPEALRVRYE
jgi:hypothetical protein